MNQSHTELAAQARERAEIHRKTPFPSAGDRLTAELLERLAAALESPTPPERVQGECHKNRNDYCKCSRAAMLCDGLGPTPPTAPAQASEGAADELIAFLDGSGQLDGVWFGEKHPTERGMFWWRKRLAALRASTPAERVPEPIRQAVEMVAEWPITDKKNMDAMNMQGVARAALSMAAIVTKESSNAS